MNQTAPPSAGDSLPVDLILPALAAALARGDSAVLVAPPGAGKTTRVPLALLDEPWVKGARIIVLEPRRLAARAAATRMAATLGERLGDTVGMRARLQTRVGPKTRIEIVTEGVFARMIMADPELTGVAAVIFDEFHERSLDADLGLALALDARQGLREDLRIVVMSATLDGARVARMLGDAPVIESEGRMFPVETIHAGRDPRARLEDEVARLVQRALRAESGSLLVFLPGQGEIRRTTVLLDEQLADDPQIDIAPLYGALDRAAQNRAVLPAAAGRRKVVLATSIAETSLTIEGVRVIVDSGLARVPHFEPGIGLTRLETVRVSRAAADQRRGRAGRTQPGVCYRMWEEAATGALEPFARPEILSADLSGLMLDLAEWGVRDPAQLAWLDPPPEPAVNEARALLQRLGALDGDGAITATGRAMRALPLPPRLARMVLGAAETGKARLAADIAAVLVERGLGGDVPDLGERVERFRRDRSRRAEDMRRLAEGWARAAVEQAATGQRTGGSSDMSDCGALLALAWPDRIARARGKPGEFLMVNGRAAALEPHEALARAPFLAIAEIAGRAAAARILAAAPLDIAEIEAVAGRAIEDRTDIVFDRASASIKAVHARKLGAIALREQPLPAEGPDAAAALARGIASLGIGRLPWSKAQLQLRARAGFLRRAGDDTIPDLSDGALAETVEDWLAPFIDGTPSLSRITADDLGNALSALVPWDMTQRIEAEAPTHFECPTGSRIALDYDAQNGPVLSVRVQELYGVKDHPAIAKGRIPLTVQLLSPAHRPIQITRDLPGFWQGSWPSVKADMKGRYPRHVWPDDPANTEPTTRAKPRGK